MEYAGSRYKGTAVGSSDYDNLFVKRDTSVVVESSEYPNYFYLTTLYGTKIDRAERLATFRDEIQRALKEVKASSFAQITKAYGPTVVVNYRTPELSFSIDKVYGLEVGDKIFVAKAPAQAGSGGTNLWYNTVVLKEKIMMRTIDFNNGTGKMVIRRLKKLKEVEPALNPINSYAFEQALMYLKDEHTDPMFWREDNMITILKVVLMFMTDALQKGSLPAYFDAHNNTIGGLSQDQRMQLANRFSRLARTPEIVLDRTN